MVVRWFRPLKYLVGWLEVPLKYLWNTTINNISHPQSQRRQKRADEEMFVCTPIWARRLKTYSWVSISSSWLNISARLFGHKLLVMCKCTKCNIRVHGFAFNIIRSQQSVDPVVHMLHQLAMCVCLKGWDFPLLFIRHANLCGPCGPGIGCGKWLGGMWRQDRQQSFAIPRSTCRAQAPRPVDASW